MVEIRRADKRHATVEPESKGSGGGDLSQAKIWKGMLGIFQEQQKLMKDQLINHQQVNRQYGNESMARYLKDFKGFKPSVFKGSTNPANADTWLTKISRLLDVLNLDEEKKITLATYQLEGEAVFWWDFVLRYRDTDKGAIKWKEFEETFVDKYFPESVRDSMETKFLELIQGPRSVGEYEAKFTELSRYAPHLVATETRRAKRFMQGLNPGIREKLVPLLIYNYSETCQRALALERVLIENAKLREKRSGQENWKNQGKKPNQDNVRPFQQNRPQVQGYQGGGPKNQRVYGTCFICGSPDHMKWSCPQNPQVQQQQQRAPQPYQGVSPPQPQCQTQLVRQGGKSQVQGKTYALVAQDSEASGVAIEGSTLMFTTIAHVLFDSGSTHSYIIPKFKSLLGIPSENLSQTMSIISPIGASADVDQVCKDYSIHIGDNELKANLIVLFLDGVDVLLGMDSLSSYHASLDCYRKRVLFKPPGVELFIFRGDKSKSMQPEVQNLAKLSGLVQLLAEPKESEEVKLEPVVSKFTDVFLDHLLGMPPLREVEFEIKLVPGTSPISVAPYRMAPFCVN